MTNHTFTPRQYFGARLEPEHTVLHGAGQDLQGFRDYQAALGPTRAPVVYMTYVGIAHDTASVEQWHHALKQQIATLGSQEVILQVGLNMTGGNDTGEGRDAEIASGVKDANIAAFCAALEDIGKPAFVRIGYEFEGEWNGYQPESYKAAFVRITQALRARDLNVATVWCSAGKSACNLTGMPLADLMTYYPGDEWVDWWGTDPFEADELLSAATHAFIAAAAAHHKPVMLGESTPREVTVTHGQASWDRWFAPYFQLIRAEPAIKCFCYINWEWVHWSNTLGFEWYHWGDCRIEQNAVVLQHYQQEMDLPLYQHARLS